MRGVLCWLSVFVLLACSRDEPRLLDDKHATLREPESARVLTGYADVALAVYEDCVSTARALDEQIDALLREPSQARLVAAQKAWLAARVPYAQSEIYRFYDGPIDALELSINTWPIDERFVDEIVRDVARYPTLSGDLLRSLNGRDGETSISTGYHVIEYLLWGRDDNATGPGTRGADDFATTDPLAQRRAHYLRLASELLLTQLTQVRDAWRPGADSFRARLLQKPYTRGLYWVFKGIGKLSGAELSGERMTVAYETKDQENEHSCFSDSTGFDLTNNARGLQNVCMGRYVRANGEIVQREGVCALVSQVAPQLGSALRTQIDKSVRAVSAIPQPFDQAILGDDGAPGRVRTSEAIREVRAVARLIERTRQTLGLDEPEQLVTRP